MPTLSISSTLFLLSVRFVYIASVLLATSNVVVSVALEMFSAFRPGVLMFWSSVTVYAAMLLVRFAVSPLAGAGPGYQLPEVDQFPDPAAIVHTEVWLAGKVVANASNATPINPNMKSLRIMNALPWPTAARTH